ncbi:FAD-binding oxidoreductase [Jiangella aurantiaca]|uniref:FAD-binding oxidoreductase n=1 Tax=Jiangella aurantiaca TaxID=2530373 RepID=A0A4R5A3X1_9ACTN|nr:FAD-binding oxidoreductase [Jiangella aurantiaca]TDD66541.1 FAD-binding oxidoreductase [Jiangella aurantiaca]
MAIEGVRPGEGRYEELRAGFNLAVTHRPAVIVEARSVDDVAAAVAAAVRERRPVGVMNTGHGPSVPADGAVLIRTGRLSRVDVDPFRRTARVEAGVRWRDVIAAAARHGLAPLNGSSPDVGAVGYTLGGGVGLLARRYGFAADHVRWLDVVTADGRVRRVDGEHDPVLFWALRGAGANFGVVTAMEFDLFPVATLYGGELCFGPEAGEDVLHAYAAWARTVPETMASSVLLLRYPDDPAVPPQLRGRHVTHLRLADSGADPAAGRELADRLRATGPRLVDTVRRMPYADVGTIHHEPTGTPVAAFDRNVLLREYDDDAAAVLGKLAGPDADAPFLTEVRAWGGALSRPPSVPNVVASRDAAFSLLAIAGPEPADRAARDQLLEAMAPWSTGGSYPNFSGVEDATPDGARPHYRSDDLARLRQLKEQYDPDRTFRVTFPLTGGGLT